MKTQKKLASLHLDKKTIAVLNSSNMQGVKGGISGLENCHCTPTITGHKTLIIPQ